MSDETRRVVPMPERNLNKTLFQGPDSLCSICKDIELDDDFRRPEHIFSKLMRSTDYILTCQNICAFCWLTRHAITEPGLWNGKTNKWIITLGNLAGHLHFDRFELKRELQHFMTSIPSCVLGIEITDSFERPERYLSTVARYRIQLLAPEYSLRNGRTKNATCWRYPGFVGFNRHYSPEDQAVVDYLPESIFCARPIPPWVDFKLLAGWIRQCHVLHVEKCRPIPMTPEECCRFRFRLIDTAQECVIDAPASCEYVCLSYVWGQVKQIQLSTANTNELYKAGGLSAYNLVLPNTIRDAIVVCQKMSFQYLWCDSLCILQDDPQDLTAHVQNMDSIYRSASLTIVAAAGSDANSGLPGVSKPRTVNRHVAMVEGYELTTIPELPTFAIKNSVWHSRAWTYQEMELSHRMLGFLPEQTYFYCQSTDWQIPIHEATVNDCDAHREHTAEMVQKPRKNGKPFKIARDYLGDTMTYMRGVQEFTARELTYESDILNAFSGMMANFDGTFNDTVNKWLFGMPSAALGWCLCWESGKERPSSPGDVVWSAVPAPTVRREGFPSWSWAGWKTRVCMGAHHSPDAHARPTINIVPKVENVPSGIFTSRAVNQTLYDKYGFHIAPHGNGDSACDLNTGILTFTTSYAKLRVARELTSEAGSADPNCERYRLTPPEDDKVHLGFIALDPIWRDQAPDLLDFIVIHAIDGLRSTRRWEKKVRDERSRKSSSISSSSRTSDRRRHNLSDRDINDSKFEDALADSAQNDRKGFGHDSRPYKGDLRSGQKSPSAEPEEPIVWLHLRDPRVVEIENALASSEQHQDVEYEQSVDVDQHDKEKQRDRDVTTPTEDTEDMKNNEFDSDSDASVGKRTVTTLPPGVELIPVPNDSPRPRYNRMTRRSSGGGGGDNSTSDSRTHSSSPPLILPWRQRKQRVYSAHSSESANDDDNSDNNSNNSPTAHGPFWVPAGMNIERITDYADSEEGEDDISDIHIYLMCVEWDAEGDVAYRIQMAGGDRTPEDWMKACPVERVVKLG